jgi:tetratricopeptide (TPR) repeat protein
MKTLASATLVAALTVAILHSPCAASDAGIAAAKRTLQQAVSSGKPDALLGARAQFQALSAAEPASAALQYWVAVASWRAVPVVASVDRKKAELMAKDGLAHCDEALRLDPGFAEALALKGGLQGMSIMFDPSSMMTLGPQSGANIARALAMAPGNPRVRLLQGIGILNTPAQFGGGADKALELFKQAQALYAADTTVKAADSTAHAAETTANAAAPDWGRDDAALWAGQSAMRLGDFSTARDFYLAALRTNPQQGWVKFRLLPAAEDSLAARKQTP